MMVVEVMAVQPKSQTLYNTMVKNLTSIIKQLTELVPKDIGVPKNDDFDDFLQTNM